MCVCGWELVVVTAAAQLLIIAYGEIEGRRRSGESINTPGLCAAGAPT